MSRAKFLSTTLSVFALFLVSGCVHQSPKADCLERHGALDIGSGSTKAVAAVVNVCEKKIERVIYEDQISLGFSETAEKSEGRRIPEAFARDAVTKIRPLSEKLKSLELKTISGVATSAFRTAKNGSETVAFLSGKIDIPIEIISQDEEARLGYWSAVARRPVPALEEVVVWDIGGGSMQMIAFEKGEPRVFRGEMASVTFKNEVLREIQRRDPRKVSSPNPLGKDWEKALALAKAHAEKSLPEYFKAKAKTAKWLGIGGVLSRSVREQVGERKIYSLGNVTASLAERSTLTDQKIGGDYAATDVTNLALVAGYLEALGLPSLESVSASLGQGWILYRLQPRTPERLSASVELKGALELAPEKTGPGISAVRGPHLVWNPRAASSTPKLLVTFGGTNSFPGGFGAFADLASSMGYAVLSLDYPNTTITTVCREHPAPDCFDRFREEIATGRDVSPHVNVNLPNSVLNRLRSAVFWLQDHDPRWKAFWKNGDVNWSRVIVAGHSQGSGHAAYLSKMFPLQGVILFAGPQDTSEEGVAPWILRSGATSSSRYHALLHRDDFFGVAGQKKALEELRRHGSAQNPAGASPLLFVVDRRGVDPHNSVLLDLFRSEWTELLHLTDPDFSR